MQEGDGCGTVILPTAAGGQLVLPWAPVQCDTFAEVQIGSLWCQLLFSL